MFQENNFRTVPSASFIGEFTVAQIAHGMHDGQFIALFSPQTTRQFGFTEMVFTPNDKSLFEGLAQYQKLDTIQFSIPMTSRGVAQGEPQAELGDNRRRAALRDKSQLKAWVKPECFRAV